MQLVLARPFAWVCPSLPRIGKGHVWVRRKRDSHLPDHRAVLGSRRFAAIRTPGQWQTGVDNSLGVTTPGCWSTLVGEAPSAALLARL
jgi:hypothetical protein